MGPDFRLLFESGAGCCLVLAPDFTIVAVADAYLQATMTKRSEIVGRGLFEVFPDNPDDPTTTGTSNLRASLERVAEHRTTAVIPVQKYDIRRPPGEVEVPYWSPRNSPVFGANGRVINLLHSVVDVTELRNKQKAEEE